MSLIISRNPQELYDQYGLCWYYDTIMTERQYMEHQHELDMAAVRGRNAGHDRRTRHYTQGIYHSEPRYDGGTVPA